MLKQIARKIEKIVITGAYKSVGRSVPPEIEKAISDGTPFKVEVHSGVLSASVNGMPIS